MSSTVGFSKVWLLTSNLVTALAWFRVLVTIITNYTSLKQEQSSTCYLVLNPTTNLALWISFVEIFNCMAGFTRSPLPAVLLFSCTRMGVEKFVAPLIPCSSWQHLLTVCSWSLGDTVRFGSLAAYTADPSLDVVKSVRFTIGPILFPIGAFGEMMMVILAAADGRPQLYIAAALWPVFFYPMMQQLLKQRKTHFQPKDKRKQIKAV